MENNKEVNYYVFRISDNQDDRKALIEEINQGRLRQGWGMPAQVTQNNRKLDLKLGKENFKEVYLENWGEYAKDSDLDTRYNILNYMCNMKKGDIIVVPKVPEYNQFTILVVSEDNSYIFDNGIKDDFAHCIKVRERIPIKYNSSEESLTVSGKFTAYQKAITKVQSEDFKIAIQRICDGETNPTEGNELSSLNSYKDKKFEELSSKIMKKIQEWNPTKLEKIIKQIFLNAGYQIIGENCYNREGGDYDLVLQHPREMVLNDIVKRLDIGDNFADIAIQIKKKKGVDNEASIGVKQLVNMNQSFKATYKILMNTADEIPEDALKLAKENNIIVLYGEELSKFICKHSLFQ